MDRVERVLEQTVELPIEAQADALMAEVARHTGHDQPLNDDATVIVVDFGVRRVRESEDAKA